MREKRKIQQRKNEAHNYNIKKMKLYKHVVCASSLHLALKFSLMIQRLTPCPIPANLSYVFLF
jgi:hypothetical protein